VDVKLVHDKPDTNYLIGDEIFLVGKWRWPNNYATYDPDGNWSAKWDDGSEWYGSWRIVKGNLVLTRAGKNWVNNKIVQFSINDLVVGETNSVRAERAK
jgi:hypothetical protein